MLLYLLLSDSLLPLTLDLCIKAGFQNCSAEFNCTYLFFALEYSLYTVIFCAWECCCDIELQTMTIRKYLLELIEEVQGVR